MSTNEIWQVELQNNIYEADTETLKQWVNEGRVQPMDRVKKGEHSWIEACRVPILRALFYQQNDLPVTADLPLTEDIYIGKELMELADQGDKHHALYQQAFLAKVMNAVCHFHPTILPDHICTACANAFCRDCTKFVGLSNAGICQFCGSLCHRYMDARQKAERFAQQREKLGTVDLIIALQYPLEAPATWLLLAGAFGLMMLPPFVSALAIIFVLPISLIIAGGMLFGCMSFAINRVSAGSLDMDYLFDLSTLIAELGNVAALSVSILLITLGPAIFLFYGAFLSVIKAQAELATSIMFSGKLYLILMTMAIVWATLYYPIAMLVWACTQRLSAVVNPLVGYQLIRVMGKDYLRYFILYLALMTVGLFQVAIIAAIFYNNMGIVMVLFTGVPLVYCNIAFACLIGRTLFKCGGKFGLAIN